MYEDCHEDLLVGGLGDSDSGGGSGEEGGELVGGNWGWWRMCGRVNGNVI